ncbi:MAG: SRPBCC family protein [Anaerolineae bacterium]
MMSTIRVVEHVDIAAPRHEVFEIVTHCERRLQLSPLWDAIRLTSVDATYPAVGSRWLSGPAQESAPAYVTVVTDYLAGQRFAYRTLTDSQATVVWTFQDVAVGTRVIYQEDFLADEGRTVEMATQVRQVVRNWLLNIKRYAELRRNRFERLLRWLADRYYLSLRPDQRNVIAAILFIHFVGAIASVMAIVAFGFTRLF